MKKLIIILIAVVATSCVNNDHIVKGVNTSSFQVGDILVFDPNNAGCMTTTDSLNYKDSIVVGGLVSKTIDSSRIKFNKWSLLHDKFMDMNDSTWKYMYNDLGKAKFYADSMKYYLNESNKCKLNNHKTMNYYE